MKTAAEAPPAAAAVDSQRSRLSSVTAATKTRGKRSLDLDLDVDRNMDPDVDLDRDSQGQASTTASGSMSSGAVDADAWTRFAAGGGRCSSSSSSSARMRVEPVGGYEGFAEVKWRDLCFSVACLETERNHMDTRADVVPVSTMNSGWSGVGVGVGVGDCSNGGSASSCSTSSVSTSSLVGHMNLIADVAPALSAFVQYDEDFVLDLVGLLASFLSPSMNMNGARMHRRYCCEVQVAALEGIRNIISPELARVAFASCLSADDTQTRPKGEALAFAVPIQKILTSPEGPAPHASKCQSEIKSARCSDRIRNLATQCLEKLLGALLNCPGQADVDFQDVLRSAAAHAARSVHDDEVLDLLHGRLFIMQVRAFTQSRTIHVPTHLCCVHAHHAERAHHLDGTLIVSNVVHQTGTVLTLCSVCWTFAACRANSRLQGSCMASPKLGSTFVYCIVVGRRASNNKLAGRTSAICRVGHSYCRPLCRKVISSNISYCPRLKFAISPALPPVGS